MPLHSYHDLDLIMACNSFHLAADGLAHTIERIFRFRPRRVCLVSELYPGLEALPEHDNYVLRFTEYFETESSFAYHHIGEALDHWKFKKGGTLSDPELRDIIKTLSFQDDHLWIRDSATVAMFWWERANNDRIYS